MSKNKKNNIPPVRRAIPKRVAPAVPGTAQERLNDQPTNAAQQNYTSKEMKALAILDGAFEHFMSMGAIKKWNEVGVLRENITILVNGIQELEKFRAAKTGK